MLFTAINTECETGVQATADANDYSIPDTPITFPAGILNMAVEVEILNDDLEEGIEFFCLQITHDKGSQNYTKIVIPQNDCKYPQVTVSQCIA